MLALVLVVLIRGPGPAWAGPRVSPDWKCNKTADATGICDDHRRVTSQKKRGNAETWRREEEPSYRRMADHKKWEGESKSRANQNQPKGEMEVVVWSRWWWWRWAESQSKLRFKMRRGRARWEEGRGGGERQMQMQMQFWKEQLRHRNVSVAASATRAAAAAATSCCWLRLCVAGANQGDIDSFHPPPEMRRPDSMAARAAARWASCGVRLQSMMERPPCHCYGYCYLLVLLPPPPAGSLKTWERKDIPASGSHPGDICCGIPPSQASLGPISRFHSSSPKPRPLPVIE